MSKKMIGYAMMVLGFIFLAACGTVEADMACTSDAQCLNGQSCQNGTCQTKGGGNVNPMPTSCTSDAQCLNGQSCQNGTCQTKGGDGGTMTPPKPNEGGNGMRVPVLDDNIIEIQSPVQIEPHVSWLKVVNPTGKIGGAACAAHNECVSNLCNAGTCQDEGTDMYPSTQSVTGYVTRIKKNEVCSPGYGFQIWIRVGRALNASMPAYGCDAGAPSLRTVIRNQTVTIKFNGTVINLVGEFVHFPHACNGGGDGNFYMGRVNQFQC